MKILIIQLARFGDIFMTAPIVHGVRRANPDCELHMLVRERFVEAAAMIEGIDSLITLNSKDILSPIICDHKNIDQSLGKVEELVGDLCKDSYDKIINFSFSPLSSYLVHSISVPTTEIFGYTRFSDGYLEIPDDPSAYFYGQIGVGKSNRVHLVDIFATIAGIELDPKDFRIAEEREGVGDACEKFGLDKSYIVVHIGASESEKTYPPFKWAQVIRRIRKESSIQIVIIGAPNESDIAQEIVTTSHVDNIVNLVGKTAIFDIPPIISGSLILVGCDSMPVQVSSLTRTPCLNLSFSTVNFWETGPRSDNSRIIYEESEVDLPSDRVGEEVISMLENRSSGNGIILRNNAELLGYEFESMDIPDDFCWNLIEALYMEGEFPAPQSELELVGYQRLNELCQLALEQLEFILIPEKREMASRILSQVDEILINIEKMVPALKPLVSWFQTERLRIGPGNLEDIVKTTEDLFHRLSLVTQLYLKPTLLEDNLLEVVNEEGGISANQKMV